MPVRELFHESTVEHSSSMSPAIEHSSSPPVRGSAIEHSSLPPVRGSAIKHSSLMSFGLPTVEHYSSPPVRGSAIEHSSSIFSSPSAIEHSSSAPAIEHSGSATIKFEKIDLDVLATVLREQLSSSKTANKTTQAPEKRPHQCYVCGREDMEFASHRQHMLSYHQMDVVGIAVVYDTAFNFNL